MESETFDALVRSLASRRRVVQALAITTPLLGAGWIDGEAKKKKKKHKKKKKPTTTPAPVCASQQSCGPNCKCFFDVNNILACYDLTDLDTCCDSAAECGPGQGCVFGACGEPGKTGGCFKLCGS